MHDAALRYLDALMFPHQPRPLPHQRGWVRAALRHLLTWWEAARGGAKTYGAARLLLSLCAIHRLRVVVAGPTFRQGRLLYKELKRLRAGSMCLREEIPEKNILEGNAETTMTFRNGSVIVCIPASGFKAHGHRSDIVVFTEAAGISKSTYAADVWPMLFEGETDAKVIFEGAAGTVADFMHGERQRVASEAAAGNRDYAVRSFDLYDLASEGFPVRVKLAEELRKVDEPTFRQMALNEWRQFSERLFVYAAMFREEIQTGDIHRAPREGWRYFAGFDPSGVRASGNVGAAAAVCLWGWDGVSHPAEVGAWELENLSHDQQAKRAADVLSRFAVERLEMDTQTVGGPVYRELMRLGYILANEPATVAGRRIVYATPTVRNQIKEMFLDLQGAVLSGAVQFPATPEAEDLVSRYEATRRGMAQLCDVDEDSEGHLVKHQHKRYDLGYGTVYGYRAFREATKPTETKKRADPPAPPEGRSWDMWDDIYGRG